MIWEILIIQRWSRYQKINKWSEMKNWELKINWQLKRSNIEIFVENRGVEKLKIENCKSVSRYRECWADRRSSDWRTCLGSLPVRRWSISKESRRFPQEWRCAIQAARPRGAWRSSGYVARWTRSWSGQRSSAKNWPTRILISTTPISVRCSVSSYLRVLNF